MFSITATPCPSDQSTATPYWLARFAKLLCGSRAAIEQARIRQRGYDLHPDAAFHDAGLSRDEAMGVGSHQDALPFFLQSGFGRQ